MVTDETLLGGAGALIAALIGLVWTDAKREVESVRKTMVSQSEFQTYIVTTKESIEGHLRADSKLHDEMKLENLQQLLHPARDARPNPRRRRTPWRELC